MSGDDKFLARWSQRKRQVAQEAPQEPKAAVAAPVPLAEPEEEAFDLSLLPSLEELTPTSDLSLFMRRGVPEALRNAALRHMWALDPAVRDYRSEALDYAWDWNAPGGVPGGGELGPGYDSSEMVARIFGDPPPDKKVIEDGAVQHVEASEPVDPLTAPEPVVARPLIEEPSNGKETEYRVEQPQGKGAAATHKGPRHGSALPAVSSKSIMS